MALTQVNTDGVKDDAVTLAKQAAGTDGQVITYDASGNPVAVGPGTDGQVLTSTGAGSPPAFEDAVSEGTQVKSTGESGGTKFLREDGDGTCSWQSGADATKMPLAGGTFTGEVIHNTTGATQLPAGTTAQRPGSPTAGDTRFNSTTSRLEFYTGSAWKTTNTEGESITVDYLVIAGGGAGGGSWRGGGGGAGGYRNSYNNEASGGGSSSETALSLLTNTAYSVIVGAGGVGVEHAAGGKGGDSTFASITSGGGGGGAQYCSGAGWTNANGGSGGGQAGCGSSTSIAGGTGTSGQGTSGGSSPSNTSWQCGGGGGGSAGSGAQGGNGGSGGDGGDGTASAITGTSVTRAGGGGGGAYDNGNNFPIAGSGGAGPGRWVDTGASPPVYYSGHDFTVQNSGSGGGGSPTPDGDDDDTGGAGGAGAKGVVIIRIPNTFTATFTAGVTSSTGTHGSDRYYIVTNTSDSSQTVTFG